jgi:hypothetical protein
MSTAIFIVFGIAVIPMVVIAICLLNGKGAFLIAGYNTMGNEERAKYDEKALCRSVGWLLIGISFCISLIPAGIYFELSWLTYCGIALILLGTVGYVIYANTGNRFRKKQNSDMPVTDGGHALAQKTAKAAIAAAVVISAVILTAVGVLFFLGEKDPAVNISDDGIEIRAMYGSNAGFADITNISLVEKSMSDIGVGKRTNGYGGFGEALKGNFKSNNLGETLLFVQSKSSPTILIERNGTKNIYISFRNAETTKALYEEMIETFSSR